MTRDEEEEMERQLVSSWQHGKEQGRNGCVSWLLKIAGDKYAADKEDQAKLIRALAKEIPPA